MAGYDPSDLLIQVEPDTCQRCGRCVISCPRRLITREGDAAPIAKDLSLCIQCGHCVAVCESGALRHSGVPTEEAPKLDDFNLTDEQLERFLRRRRSIRRFKKQEIAPETLDRLFDLARFAPTGKNKQAVHHTVLTGDRIRQLEVATAGFYRKLIGRLGNPFGRLLVRSFAGRKTLDELLWGLPDLQRDVARVDRGDRGYCHGAPVVVAVHAEPSSTAAEDCSFAVYHLMLAAETLGLGTCLIGYAKAAADRTQAPRDVVELPDGHQIYSVVAIGHPAEEFFRLPPRRPANVRKLQ